MGNFNGGISKDHVTISAVSGLTDMLKLFQEIAKNPSIVDEIGERTAKAYAVAQEEIDKRDALNAEMATATARIAECKDIEASILQKTLDLQNLQTVQFNELAVLRKEGSDALKSKEDDLASRELALKTSQDEHAANLEALAKDKADLETLKSSLVDKETYLKDLEAKINQLKAALG